MGAAAAVIIRREKDIVEHFRRVGALDPDTAQTPDVIDTERGGAWRLLVSGAVIRSTDDGRFYLDEQSWAALGRRRRRMLAVVLVALAAVAVAMYQVAAHRQ